MSEPTEDQRQEAAAGAAPEAAHMEAAGDSESQRAAPEAAAADPAAPRAPGRALAIVAIIVSLGAVGGVLWHWYSMREQSQAARDSVAKELAQFEAQSRDALAAAREIRQANAGMQSRIAALEDKVADIGGGRERLETLYRDLSRGRDERVLAEIEQSLLIANQQLQIAGNVKAALVALESAANRLQHAGGAQSAGLRKSIARDIERLQALPDVDVAAIAGRIEKIGAAIDGLPLAADARPRQSAPAGAGEEAGAGAWQRFWRQAWAEVKQLIRVERMDRKEPLLMAPAQRYFLRENLKLKLLAARVALLARDEKGFRTELETVRSALARYFDASDPDVARVSAALGTLHETTVAFEVPDISATVGALRKLNARDARSAR